MKAVRIGIVGCGVIGTAHLKVASQSPGIELAAAADLRPEPLQQAKASFEIPTVYTSAEELIGDPQVEAVVLAMPAFARTPLALKAFAAGKHVLTEKPVAINAGDVQAMIEAKGDLVAGCCSGRLRFLPSAEVASEFLARGGLGKLRIIRCRAVRSANKKPDVIPPVWRLNKRINGGGILMNWGCYDLDFLLGITGWSLKPCQAFARAWATPAAYASHIAPGSDAEAHFAALIACEGGTVISFERGEYVTAKTDEAWQIIGDRGSLRLNMMAEDHKTIWYDEADSENGVITKALWEGTEDADGIHSGPLMDFARAIRGNGRPNTTLENALVVQKISDAIYESARQGVAVEID